MVLMTRAVAVLHALSHRERHHSFLLSYTFFLRDFHVCLFFRIDLHRLLYPLVKWKVVKLFKTSTGSSEIRQSNMALIMSIVLSVFCNVLDGFLFKKKRNKKYFDVILQNHFFFHFHVREKNIVTIQSFNGKKRVKISRICSREPLYD